MSRQLMRTGRPGNRAGFTMVEMMVSTAVLALLVVLMVGITSQANQIWRRASGKVEQFRETRAAFEAMTTRLAQATLNTYWDYDNPVNPTRYDRRSDLRFISGPANDILGGGGARPRLTHSVFFQAPLGEVENAKYHGFENLLCTWGYYLEYGDDLAFRPEFLTDSIVPRRYRHRLMELRQPAEQNRIYSRTSGLAGSLLRARTYVGKEWYQESLSGSNAPVRVAAENVIALIITPRLGREDEKEFNETGDRSPLAPDYLYDSSPVIGGSARDERLNPVGQLPPLLQVTMVAIDEISAQRLSLSESTPDPFDLESRFRSSGDYSKDLLLSGDSGSLENQLIKRGTSYRIFSTNVVIRGAKWSREQKF